MHSVFLRHILTFSSAAVKHHMTVTKTDYNSSAYRTGCALPRYAAYMMKFQPGPRSPVSSLPLTGSTAVLNL